MKIWKRENGKWKTQTSSCEELCIKKGEHGCCYLGTGLGCYWKGGADHAGNVDISPGLAVSCSKGMLHHTIRYINDIFVILAILSITF